jgi:hypothetical protein
MRRDAILYYAIVVLRSYRVAVHDDDSLLLTDSSLPPLLFGSSLGATMSFCRLSVDEVYAFLLHTYSKR